MKVILHIGAHKTGTTTIQEYCAQNRSALATAGLVYPDLSEAGGKRSFGHHDFSAAFSDKPRKSPTRDSLAAYMKEIDARVGADDTVLFSAEPIYRHVLGASADDDFWTGHRKYLESLATFFAPWPTEILLVLRRQDTFAESLFQENVKSRFYAGDFPRFLEEFGHFWEYRRRIELLREIFGAVTVLGYEKLSENGLCDAFLDRLGVSTTGLQDVERKNASLPTQMVLFQQAQNARLTRDAARQLRFRLMELAEKGACDFEPVRLFSKEKRLVFLDGFVDDNTWLAEQFGPPADAFFPAKVPDTEGRHHLLPDESFAVTAALLESLLVAPEKKGRGVLRRLLGKRK